MSCCFFFFFGGGGRDGKVTGGELQKGRGTVLLQYCLVYGGLQRWPSGNLVSNFG